MPKEFFFFDIVFFEDCSQVAYFLFISIALFQYSLIVPSFHSHFF